MGTNRKEQKGNQLVECLTLYHEYVKHGKQPPETKNSFCIPAEWIKTLDPRVKEKIRTETRADMEAKGQMEREKKEADLDKKIKAKKATEADKQMELKTFGQILENRIQNEIAKRIDKAYSYSFNLANYKSSLNLDLFDLPDELDFNFNKINDSNEVEKIYKSLQKNHTHPEITKIIVQTLNLGSALEADIAREYISNLDNDLITKHNELHVIKEILKSGAKYPMVSIKETCSHEKGKLPTQATPEGNFPFVVTAKDRKSAPEYQFDDKAVCIPLISSTGHGSATLKRIHYQEGKFALANLLFAAIPNNPETELYPKFLYHILDARREELFCPLMKGTANVAMKMDDAVNVRFPLPDFDLQMQIVAQIEKQKAIVEGAEKVLNNWQLLESDFVGEGVNYSNPTIDAFASVGTGSTPSREVAEYFKGENNWVLTNEVAMNEISETAEKLSDRAIQDYGLKIYPVNTILIAMYGQGKTRGQSALLKIPASITQNCGAIVIDEEKAVPKYVWFYLMSAYDKIRGQDYSGAGVPHLNLSIVKQIRVPLPDDLDAQFRIVSELEYKFQLLEGLRKMKAEAEKRIGNILADVWGVDVAEPIREEVTDEKES